MEAVREEVEKKIEEAAPVIKETLDKIDEEGEKQLQEAVSKIEDHVEEKVEEALKKLEESAPEIAKLVDVVDEALVGRSCSVSFFGWVFSVERRRHPLATPKQ